jgi:hypothetical protein
MTRVICIIYMLSLLLGARPAAAKPTSHPVAAVQTEQAAPPAGHGADRDKEVAPGTPEPPPLLAPPPRERAPALVELAPPPPRRGHGLRAAGWTCIALGGAATVSGLALFALPQEGLPLEAGVVPLLAGGAGLVILGRFLLSAGEARRWR